MPRYARFAGLLALVVTGCDGDPVADLPLLPVSISPQAAYAGAPVTIRSDRFTQLSSLEIWADTFQLTILARTGDSVIAALPRRARGSYTLRLGKSGPELGTVQISGFVGRRPVSRIVNPELMVWQVGARTSVLAGTPGGDIVEIIPSSGSVTTLLSGYDMGSSIVARKAGRTPDPSVLLFQPRGGGPQHAWRLSPTPQQLYTIPWPNLRRFAQLSDSVFLNLFHHRLNTFRYSGSSVFEGGYEDGQDVVMSQVRRIATLVLNGSSKGIPVFNTMTGDTLYHIPFWWSAGATFSQAGDTLWMVGGAIANSDSVQVAIIDPANGSFRRSATLRGYYVYAMMRDPANGRLFIFGLDKAERFAGRFQLNMFVLDDRDLRLLGQIQTPSTIECNQQCADWGQVAVGMDGVFLVTNLEIYEFDYLQ